VQELALAMTGEEGRRLDSSELVLLLRRAKAGDVAAVEEILLRHERLVFRTAHRLLGSVEDAQDASQEVFLRLHQHLRCFDAERAVAPWLYRVTVNVCWDIAGKRKKDVPLESVELAAPAEQAADYSREEMKRVVQMALRRLPEKERAALVLRDIEGLPTGEVARVMGSSEATVRSQISSARLKIKRFADSFRGRIR